MPIKIPRNLPAFDILQNEGVMVMSSQLAEKQDIRPLQIILLNLMPEKIKTETQFARLIGSTPLQIEFTLLRVSSHISKNTSKEHLENFYKTFDDVCNQKYDGLIITGAPIEHLPFEEVDYWGELEDILEWAKSSVHSVFGVCWGAMAMLYYFHKIEKKILKKKYFGLFRHKNKKITSHFLRGFSDDLIVPVSRWTEILRADIARDKNLEILLDSSEVGPCLVEDRERRFLFLLNHLEYDSNTLNTEYLRDKDAEKSFQVPKNYFPNDDPKLDPINRWRSHAHLLYGNWINEIYQTTPFDIEKIGLK
ncbi:homoserine O-succinyltransferase [Paracoccaceae bacterium]|nr:homoserine O-succinyltransferase [Paracoccaceae bacterium]